MALGDITQLDTYLYLGAQARYVNVVHAIDNVYLAFTTGSGTDGYVYSVTIDENGDIDTVLSSLEWNELNTYYTTCIKVKDGTVLAVCAAAVSKAGHASTLSVDGSGNIAVIDTETFSSDYYTGGLCEVADSVFAVVGRGVDDDGWLWTLSVTAGGLIAVEDSLEFSPGANVEECRIVKLVNNLFVICAETASNDILYTVEIADSGAIDVAGVIDTDAVDFDGAAGTQLEMCKISDSVIAIVASTSATPQGVLVTMQIDADGTITASNIDYYGFAENLLYGHIIYTGAADQYAIMYNDSTGDNPVYIATVTISSAGVITAELNDSNTLFDTSQGGPVWQILLSTGLICGVARAPGYTASLATYSIATGSGPRTPTSTIYAPVSAIPRSTSGRNGTGYASGHEVKYVLDNDPDTWWKPSAFTDSSMYIDLGSAVSVDAVVLWLHNYNDGYDNDKAWQLSYSDDDITYTDMESKLFSKYRTEYVPVVIDNLSFSITARYWKLTLIDFDSTPQTVRPEISCVWFTNTYTLPWSHQLPENNSLVYHNIETVTRSGCRFTSTGNVGKQRVVQRDFIFTADTDQWDNLLAAYAAAKGSNLPVIMRLDADSDIFYAVQFDIDLVRSEDDYQYKTPTLKLRELGCDRVPYSRHSLPMTPYTIAMWRFRDDLTDSSNYGNDWSQVKHPPVTGYQRGILEQNNSVLNISGSTYLQLNSADVGDFNMGTQDFSIEAWVNVTEATQCILRIAANDFIVPTGGFSIGVYGTGVLYTRAGDGTFNEGSQTAGPDLTDGEWHYVAMSVDRTNDELRSYVDGTKISTRDIAAMTGNVWLAGANMYSFTLNKDNKLVDEIHVAKGHAFTDAEILARFNHSVDDYGTWGI